MLRYKSRSFLKKHKEKISYLFFGACTTAVNLVVFQCLLYAAGKDMVTVVNAVSILCAVIFAYITNTLFVFGHKLGWGNFVRFCSARAFSAVVEIVGVFLIDLVSTPQIAKLVMQVVVVVLNYVLSVVFVFAKKESEEGGSVKL